MQEFCVCGGRPLEGQVRVQGAKNSVLPLMAASLLCSENTVELTDVPLLSDVEVSVRLLQKLGCTVTHRGHVMQIDATNAASQPLEQCWCQKMRSSVLYLGPMLGRFGRAQLCYPGGCVLGERPIDLHIAALEQMGTVFDFREDAITATCPHGLQGAVIRLPFPSVGATENILMAACLAKGETLLYNGAEEPEIDDLIDLLRCMGAEITKTKECISIRGVEALHGCTKAVMADRIVAFTLMAAALATDGEITLENCPVGTLGTPMEVLAAAGAALRRQGNRVTVRRAGPFVLPVEEIVSGPYPAFPTDGGAIIMALLTLAQGRSSFTETVFSDRFRVAEQLQMMGADIALYDNRAVIHGVSHLVGRSVRATDLRAGAALLVAALAAKGESCIEDAGLILRGYEDVVGMFTGLGAKITERSG